MALKPKHQRLLLILVALCMIGGAITLILQNFRDNLVFFYSPAEFYAKQVPQGKKVRIGGLVRQGSVFKSKDALQTAFILTDFTRDVPVLYEGLLPGLFRAGQGMVAYGYLASNGLFIAEELLAKHDEKYMPPEVANALKKSGQWQEPKPQDKE